MERLVRAVDHWPLAWGFYLLSRIADLTTTVHLLRRAGFAPEVEGSPVPRFFMSLYGAAIGNWVHEAVMLGVAILIYFVFPLLRLRWRRWLGRDGGRRRVSLGRLPGAFVSVIDRLSPNVFPFAAGLGSAVAAAHNLMLIWKG